MSLYAIGDFHLSFSTDKSMDIFDSVWKNHEKKIEKYFNKIIKPTDTVVMMIASKATLMALSTS